ncbi:MAG: M23 family metallopeptidase [Acidobacteria bacterium]|nr:MAG: M23 family metallopeptidase [Acidobacteriota bacterium]
MFLNRRFTIMVVPDARARMRRFHLRGAHLVAGAAAIAVLSILAASAPVGWLRAHRLASDLAAATRERDELAGRAEEIESTLAELRDRLDKFEQRTQKLAAIAGLDLPSLGPGGQGVSVGTDTLGPAERTALLGEEAEELASLGTLLGRRLDTVERAIGAQSERLARTPSILPVRGLIGAGFAWRRDPFTGRRQFHRGIDISAPEGTPVHAPGDAVVVKAERHRGYGKVLYLSHGDGIVTRYGHLSEFKVRPGDKVRRGDVIGLVGTTGRSTAPHLHYEVLVQGRQVDPMRFVLDEALFY